MSLKSLIDKQEIDIDDHKRGASEIKDWDDKSNDIHIHKNTYFPINGKKQKVVIRIPINTNNQIKITNRNSKLGNIPLKLKKEIKQAFEDDKIRDEFITDLIKILRNFSSILTNEQKARDTLEILSKHFGLNWSGEKIASYLKDILDKYTETFEDIEGVHYFITVDNNKIKIGHLDKNAKKEIEKQRKK